MLLVSAEAASARTLAALRRARAHQETARRALRPLGLVAVALATGATFRTDPRPGWHGTGLGHRLSRGGAHTCTGLRHYLSTRTDRLRLRTAVIVGLLASSLVLVWLQPRGVGFVGLFVAVVLLARRMPSRAGLLLTGVGFAILVLISTVGSHQSAVSDLLRAAVLVGFYTVAVLAQRLGAANQQAERLLLELEASRDMQARAAAMAERQRLAREMHDVLAHSLSGLMLQLEGARILAAEQPDDPRLPGTIERAHQLGRTGLAEARRAIAMLRDEEVPGPERLATLAGDFARDHGIPCDLVVTGAERELDSQARLAVYRVAQEALTNTVKHAAAAARVQLRLDYGTDRACLTVEDFGGGPPTPGHAESDGYGLTGMRERAELLGGSLSAEPTGAGLPGRTAGARMSDPIRVLTADDQRVVREGLAMLLGLIPGVEVVGTASDGAEAVSLAGELHPDVVLMDLRMPRCDGVEATRLLREQQPAVKVVVLTTYADDRSVVDALRAGARGYLTKDAGAADISHALHRVVADQAVIDPAVQHHLVDAIASGPPERETQTSALPRRPDAPGDRSAHPHRRGTVEC